MKTIEDAVRYRGGIWPFETKHKNLYYDSYTETFFPFCYSGQITTYICTRSEFEECARRLRNEPSWNDAPDWATSVAQGANGLWYWLEDAPDFGDYAYTQDGRILWAATGEVIGDWRDTLRLRPEEKKMEDKNDWHKKGELPPVGTVCEMLPWWHVCESIAPHRDGMVMYNHSEDAYFLATKNTRFRPLQTERERVVKAWIEKIEDSDILNAYLGGLYDIGALKMPGDK